MANPWDNDEVVSEAPLWANDEVVGPPPWANDEVVREAPTVARAQQLQPQPNRDSVPVQYLKQAGSGVLDGITGVLGAPIDLSNAAIGLGLRGINSVFGTNFKPSDEPLGGSKGLRKGLPDAGTPDGAGQQWTRRVSQSVGGFVPFLGQAKTLQQGLTGIGTAFGGGVGGATAQQLFPGNPYAEMGGELLGNIGSGAAAFHSANRSAQRAAEKAVPSVDQLKKRANHLYDQAERHGVAATQQQTQGLANDFRKIATDEGLIWPNGTVSKSYPRAEDALGMVDAYATGTMNPTQMQTARKTLSDAANSTKGQERRIASIMLDKFDNFTDPLSPTLKNARSVYSRMARGEGLEELRDLAGNKASQFSGSGFENALRTEYRGLNKDIIKGNSVGWTKEQRDAIRAVSEGTKLANMLRTVGKAAPTGVMSAGLSGGVPFMIGNAIGGPALGVGLGLASWGVGGVARKGATMLTDRSASLAELMARNGGPVQAVGPTGIFDPMFFAALGGQTAISRDK